jgi:hypothetical protein
MAQIYEDKKDCDFCDNSGWIDVYNFHYVSLQNRLAWNKETRIVALKQKKICPLCSGKSYLHIIKQKKL